MIVVLGAIEIGVVAFLGHRFLPGVLAWIIDVVGIGLLVVSTLGVASVLWRRHSITGDEVRVVLGYLGGAAIPRAAIAHALDLSALPATAADQTGPAWRGDDLCLVSATGVDRVRLVLQQPVRARRLWQRRMAHAIEIGVVDPGFVEALSREV